MQGWIQDFANGGLGGTQVEIIFTVYEARSMHNSSREVCPPWKFLKFAPPGNFKILRLNLVAIVIENC